ncbi:YybH family protein [Adhaeribacter radiodurans]|uniref:Nuclear transport factor 2 family protein n=1 Tax=Adhaeribacter radiodurans TaxID=2745197 RepID=A0A7L7LDQ9_9BACT|nr:nuclear transport factor 2 family protein [Adhaeribacter radiodurans]QMU30941.1 nuclear transport factor 2 family protein [Adhaeribacter radiodurans]
MKNKLLFFLLFLLPLRNALAQKVGPDTTAILQVLNQQVQAWNQGDIDSFMRTYWNSPDLVFVSGTTVTKGWRPTLERYKKTYGSRAKMGTLQFTKLQVSAIAKDSATVLGNWALTRAGDHPHGKFTLKFRKFNNQWFIVRDQTIQE